MAAIRPPKRVLISVNPKAGARSCDGLVEMLCRGLSSGGYEVETISDIDQLARAAAAGLSAGGLRAVISAGGDGTVALIANRTPPGTPIAIFPLGTENLLAKHLGMIPHVDALIDAVKHGKTLTLDAGEANGRLFLLMVGCGFDADVVQRLHRVRTGHIHHFSYAKPILDSIWNYQYPELLVYCDPGVGASAAHCPDVRGADVRGADVRGADPGNIGEFAGARPVPISARWVFVGNLPRYAGGLKIVPNADGSDGLLDLCTFKGGSLWNGLRYLSGVMLGQHHTWEDCTTRRAPRLRIESVDGEVPFQMDGDPGGVLPVDIRVLPHRLTFLVPNGAATPILTADASLALAPDPAARPVRADPS